MADIAKHFGSGVSNGSVVAGVVDGSVALNNAIQEFIGYQDGALQPSAGLFLTNAPQFSFRTRDLDFINAPTAMSSFRIASKAYSDAGGVGTASISFAAASGVLIPGGISVGAGGVAELTVVGIPLSSDGTSSPITPGTTAIAAGTHGDIKSEFF